LLWFKKEGEEKMHIEELIAEKIKKIDPTVDPQGADRKMLELTYKDFVNYTKFYGIFSNNAHIEEKLEKLSRDKKAELDAFLTVWTSMWMKKWQERVKLLIGKKHESDELHKTLAKAEPTWQTLEYKEELINIVGFTFIKDGEICSSEMLAEYALKVELSKEDLDLKDKAQALTFLNNVIRRAHEIAKTKGPLIFVEINKKYYTSAMNQSVT
jgi:hypothetical protein